MPDSVELAARTDGLFPIWLFLILLIVWIAAIRIASLRRVERFPELPYSLAAIGSLVLAAILFFWRPLFTGAHLPRGGGDLNSFFFSLHAYSAERLNAGEIPLWNPTLHGGMPHLGNFQAGLLYPPNLLAYALAQPFSYGTLEWLAMAHYLIASLGTYLLLRALGANRTGAVAGGLIFAYGGFFVAHLGHYSMISAAAWVPWIFWCVYRLVELRSWLTAALLAFLVFLCATGGHQQTLLFALAGAGIWWLFLHGRLSGIRIPGVGRTDNPDAYRDVLSRLWTSARAIDAAQFALGVGCGLLLAAPMILPSLQLARHSVRSALTFEQASEFSVQPVALLQLLLPTVFGSNPTDYWGAFSSGEIWGYVGVTTLVVAAVGLALRPDAIRLVFAGFAILAVFYALGPAAPVHGWFYQFVPGFDLVRAPARAYLFLNLSLAVLSGLAVTDLGQRVRHPGIRWSNTLRRTIRFLVVVVGAVGLIIIPLFYTRILGIDDPTNRPVITVENLWMLLIFLSLLLLSLWLARARLLRSAALGLAVAAIMTIDLFSATMPFNPTGEDLVARYRQPETSAFLQGQWEADGPFRIDVRHAGLLPNFGAIDGLHVASGVFDPMQPNAYSVLNDVLSDRPDIAAYGLLNVRYWILPADAEPPPGFDPAFQSGAGHQVWERESALPRAWFVSEAVGVGDDETPQVLQRGGIDPATQVILDENVDLSADGATGEAAVTGYSAEEIAIAVDVDGPGYVVISDGYYPGWSAEVDGQDAPILRANYGIRAIPVDQSSQQIKLRYEPDFVTYGLIGAGLGGLLLIGMIAGPFIVGRVPAGRAVVSAEATGR